MRIPSRANAFCADRFITSCLIKFPGGADDSSSLARPLWSTIGPLFHAHDDRRSCPNIDEVEIIVIESELRNDAHESLKNRCRVIPVAKPGSLLWQRRAALAWLHASLADKSAGSSVQLPCYLVIPLVICTWCFDSIYSLSLWTVSR